jgi:hypothetical protein
VLAEPEGRVEPRVRARRSRVDIAEERQRLGVLAGVEEGARAGEIVARGRCSPRSRSGPPTRTARSSLRRAPSRAVVVAADHPAKSPPGSHPGASSPLALLRARDTTRRCVSSPSRSPSKRTRPTDT